MLLFSSVAVAGSEMPAGGFSLKSARAGCNRFERRSSTATPAAAKRPEINAMINIWRAESLYILRLQAYGFLVESESFLDARTTTVVVQTRHRRGFRRYAE